MTRLAGEISINSALNFWIRTSHQWHLTEQNVNFGSPWRIGSKASGPINGVEVLVEMPCKRLTRFFFIICSPGTRNKGQKSNFSFVLSSDNGRLNYGMFPVSSFKNLQILLTLLILSAGINQKNSRFWKHLEHPKKIIRVPLREDPTLISQRNFRITLLSPHPMQSNRLNTLELQTWQRNAYGRRTRD